MNKLLYKKFLEEQIEELSVAMLYHGVNGLFEAFEQWLVDNDFLERDNEGEYKKWTREEIGDE